MGDEDCALIRFVWILGVYVYMDVPLKSSSDEADFLLLCRKTRVMTHVAIAQNKLGVYMMLNGFLSVK